MLSDILTGKASVQKAATTASKSITRMLNR